MGVNVPASSDYEAEANRVRKQIDETVKELRSRLTPSSLASEAAMGVGTHGRKLGGRVGPRRQAAPDPDGRRRTWARSVDFLVASQPIPGATASPVSHRR